MKRGLNELNASAENIDTCQPMQFPQADLDRNFLPTLKFFLLEG